MALPIVAIVGRPNVGKSTLVNRIAENNEAIVHEMRGVTRDRSYHEADWNGREFTLIDTGGIEMNKDDVFQESIRSQALVAAEQADVILFLVDSKTGINADDQAVANILRRSNKPVLLVVNKLDNPNDTNAMWEFMQLGLGEPWPVSALHGTGTGDLLDEVVQRFPEPTEEEHDELDAINHRTTERRQVFAHQQAHEQRSLDRFGCCRHHARCDRYHDRARRALLHDHRHGWASSQERDR